MAAVSSVAIVPGMIACSGMLQVLCSWCETCKCAEAIDKITQLNVSSTRTIVGRKP